MDWMRYLNSANTQKARTADSLDEFAYLPIMIHLHTLVHSLDYFAVNHIPQFLRNVLFTSNGISRYGTRLMSTKNKINVFMINLENVYFNYNITKLRR